MKATIRLTNSDIVYILDQTKLPFKECYESADELKVIIFNKSDFILLLLLFLVLFILYLINILTIILSSI